MFLFWNTYVPSVKEIFKLKRFLRKLTNLNIWGGKHTELTNLRKCVPTHLRGTKIVNQAIKELVNLEFINLKISTYETHLSLNPRKKKEIY